jgi:hypothetical protein
MRRTKYDVRGVQRNRHDTKLSHKARCSACGEPLTDEVYIRREWKEENMPAAAFEYLHVKCRKH